MNTLRYTLLLGLFAAAALHAQPEFGPVRLDSGNDNTFFYPALEVTNSGTLRCAWTSGNEDWMGAYEREADIWGNPIGAQDTVDLQSAAILTCPPRVTFQSLSTGAWAKIIYHE